VYTDVQQSEKSMQTISATNCLNVRAATTIVADISFDPTWKCQPSHPWVKETNHIRCENSDTPTANLVTSYQPNSPR